MDLREENYENITNENNFICLNKKAHDCIHYLYRYYVKDRSILDRTKEILDRMIEINEEV